MPSPPMDPAAMSAAEPTPRPDLASLLKMPTVAAAFEVAPDRGPAHRVRLSCRWTIDRQARRLVRRWRAAASPAAIL
jgi:hypothetical protein